MIIKFIVSESEKAFSFLLEKQQLQPLCFSIPCEYGLYESSRSCRVMNVVLQDCSAGDARTAVL